MPRGSSARDARPGAAADASWWPAFAFEDVHCTGRMALAVHEHAVRMTAPTWWNSHIMYMMYCRIGEYVTSIGSPSAVPVPCASSAQSTASSVRTAAINRLCDEPFGAVRLALGPSYYTAEPRNTTVFACALARRKKPPQPSPRQYPSARWSKVWLRPPGDIIPAIAVALLTASLSILVPVPTPCRSASPAIITALQRCSTAKVEEQAVSIE